MKAMILGGTGMLGHKLAQTLKNSHETYATVRQRELPMELQSQFDQVKILSNVRADDFSSIETAIKAVSPAVVINCIGIVKQLTEAEDSIASITINALLPHKLALVCKSVGARFITLSTDCVFSGTAGNYSQDDSPDPVDLYGRTKLLGEVDQENCLTIRTSMIGRQLVGSHGLVEWLLSQDGQTVKGYRKAIFSGFTTNELSNIIRKIIERHPELHGIWQAAAEPISKFDLLNLIKDVYRLSVRIVGDDAVVCDRSLNGVKFREATGIVPIPWPDMIDQMNKDLAQYPPSKLLKC